jgi:hypothetical protein
MPASQIEDLMPVVITNYELRITNLVAEVR